MAHSIARDISFTLIKGLQGLPSLRISTLLFIRAEATKSLSTKSNLKRSLIPQAVADKIPHCEVTINTAAPPDKRSYKVNFDLYEALAPNHQPTHTLQNTIDELVVGITEIKHLIKEDFRSSDFMRLHILESHLKSKRLSNNLRWLT